MTEPSHEDPSLDDVMEVTEPVHPHRREHAKASPRPDEDELDRKVEIERREASAGDAEGS